METNKLEQIMLSFGQRVKERREALGMSQTELGSSFDPPVGRGAVSKWESDINKPSVDQIPTLARKLKTSLEWLIIGVHKDGLQSAPIKMLEDNNGDDITVPFLDQFHVSCGTGTLAEALASEAKEVSIKRDILRKFGVSPSAVVLLPAIGNSMEPVIREKAVVYVDLNRQQIVDGKIYAVRHGGLFKFKYLYNLPKNGVRIASENREEFPEERLSAEEVIDQEFEIIGYAFYVESSLP